jgi:DNA (cytosine-5)-methyltransferase 1
VSGPLDGAVVIDAFSCKGGSGLGWRNAGATVKAVDIVDYGATYAARNDPLWSFHHGDAVDFILEHGSEATLVSASAPCQPWTRGNAPRRNALGIDPRWEHATYIDAARAAAEAVGVPFILENVEGARAMLHDPLLLCGRMFGLEARDTHPDAVGMRLLLDRHRLFEFGGMPRPDQPAHGKHRRTSGIALGPDGERLLTGRPHVAGVYGGARRDPWEAKYVRHGGYVPKDLAVLQALLGSPHIDTEHELFESIPPVYIEFLAKHLARVLD